MQSPEGAFTALESLCAGRSQAEFESTALNLSPQERRLYEYLRDHGLTSTIEIRQNCAIGNVSSAAMFLNRKFERAGESLRVVCQTRTLTNRYGERGIIGWWHLVDTGHAAA
jgi:hypothetical protein